MEENIWKNAYAGFYLGISLKIKELNDQIGSGNYTGSDEQLIGAKLEMLSKLGMELLNKAEELHNKH